MQVRVGAVGVRVEQLGGAAHAALGLGRLAEQEQVAAQPHERATDGDVVAQRGEALGGLAAGAHRFAGAGARCRAPTRSRRAPRRARAVRGGRRAAAASRSARAPGGASPPAPPRPPRAARIRGSRRDHPPRRRGASGGEVGFGAARSARDDVRVEQPPLERRQALLDRAARDLVPEPQPVRRVDDHARRLGLGQRLQIEPVRGRSPTARPRAGRARRGRRAEPADAGEHGVGDARGHSPRAARRAPR